MCARVTQKGVSTFEDARYEDHAPAWAPGGKTLAFERFDRKTDRQAVFTVHVDGTSLRQLTPGRWMPPSLTTRQMVTGSSFGPRRARTRPETSG